MIDKLYDQTPVQDAQVKIPQNAHNACLTRDLYLLTMNLYDSVIRGIQEPIEPFEIQLITFPLV